jgi:hypothetical protein
MEENTTNTVLTLFSVRADYVGCEYGSLFIVAAPDASHAEDIVRAQFDWCDATIERCDPIGTTDMFADPMVVDQFAT